MEKSSTMRVCGWKKYGIKQDIGWTRRWVMILDPRLTKLYNFATSHNVLLAKLTEGDKHRLLTNKKAQQAI